jgi:hypothetical protein
MIMVPQWLITVLLVWGLFVILRRSGRGRGRWWGSSGHDGTEVIDRQWRELAESQQQHIEQLEARVGELEERIDFTERLLSRKSEVRKG